MWCAVQIDGLIVNCTAFNPTPSLSAAVVKHFKFKSSIRTVNLSGMGCAASVISVDIARDMLKVRIYNSSPHSVSGTPGLYRGLSSIWVLPALRRALTLLQSTQITCAAAPARPVSLLCVHGLLSGPGVRFML